MKSILNKISAIKENQGDNFKLASAVVVGILLLSFIGASFYVLISSLS